MPARQRRRSRSRTTSRDDVREERRSARGTAPSTAARDRVDTRSSDRVVRAATYSVPTTPREHREDAADEHGEEIVDARAAAPQPVEPLHLERERHEQRDHRQADEVLRERRLGLGDRDELDERPRRSGAGRRATNAAAAPTARRRRRSRRRAAGCSASACALRGQRVSTAIARIPLRSARTPNRSACARIAAGSNGCRRASAMRLGERVGAVGSTRGRRSRRARPSRARRRDRARRPAGRRPCASTGTMPKSSSPGRSDGRARGGTLAQRVVVDSCPRNSTVGAGRARAGALDPGPCRRSSAARASRVGRVDRHVDAFVGHECETTRK